MIVRKPCVFAFILLLTSVAAIAQEFKSGIEWSEPPIVTPGATNDQPPSDAIVLFDGKDMSAWTGGSWQVKDGIVYSSSGDVTTKQKFGDIQLHLEWSAPTEVKGSGQGRGNSGVFLMERYEVQVLDSYENQTYFDGQAGSVYKQTAPMANAMRKPGEWNTYEIFWTAPTFKVSGDVKTPAYVTVVHNGVLLLNHFELYGPTNYLGPAKYEVHEATAPIRLQDHGNPVRFRNIWVRELHAPVGKRTSAPYVILKGQKVSPDAAAAEKETSHFNKEVEAAVKKALKAAEKQAEANAASKGDAEKKSDRLQKAKPEQQNHGVEKKEVKPEAVNSDKARPLSTGSEAEKKVDR